MSTPSNLESFDDVEELEYLQDQIGFKLAQEAAVLEAERVLAMTPAERQAHSEAKRCASVRRILGRAPGDDADQEAFYLLLAPTQDAPNRPLDGMGNTIAHLMANPSLVCVEVDGEWVWQPATFKQKAAMEDWSEVCLVWARPDPLILNNMNLSAIDLACMSSPYNVEILLAYSDLSSRDKKRAMARAVIMAAAGLSQATVTPDELVETILTLGADLDRECGFLECNNAIRSSATFRQKLGELTFPLEHRERINLMLMTKKERDAMDVRAVHSMLTKKTGAAKQALDGTPTIPLSGSTDPIGALA